MSFVGRYLLTVSTLHCSLWDDMTLSTFPAHLKEAIRCDEKLLPSLSIYMDEAARESRDVIISNPWLARPGSADALSQYLDPVFDVKIVVYYQRYFEWITLKYNSWRQDLFENSLSQDSIPLSSLRFVDFVREYCKRLFYGKVTLHSLENYLYCDHFAS